MKFLFTITLALTLIPSAVHAVGHERIPLDSWAYRALERFEALGLCTLPEDRPFTRDEFIRIVRDIETRASGETLSARDAYELERLQQEFTNPDAVADPRNRYDRAWFGSDSLLAVEADIDLRGFVARVPFGEDEEYFAASAPTAKIHIGDRVTYDVRYQLVFGPEHGDRADDHKPSRRTKSFDGLTAEFDRSYVSAVWSQAELVVGRDHVQWGPSDLEGGLITPGLRYGIDQLGGRLRFKSFRLDAFQGQLFGEPERWMAAHRLEGRFGRTVVGLSETVLYNSRGLDMLY